MFKAVVIVFLLGWSVWFLIDKSPAGIGRLPEPQDDILENFQTAFNILKAGYLKPAYTFIWHAHYLLLSVLGGLLASMAWQSISSALARKRLRKLYIPERRKTAPENSHDASEKTD